MKQRTKKKSPSPTSFQITDELLQRIGHHAKSKGVSRSAVIRWALSKYFESHQCKVVNE